jgi:hypothetical protein
MVHATWVIFFYKNWPRTEKKSGNLIFFAGADFFLVAFFTKKLTSSVYEITMEVNNQPQQQQQQPVQPGIACRQQRNRRSTAKTVQYTSVEVHALLRLAEQMLPVDGEDWDKLTRLHNLNFPTNGWDSAKLKRKFQQLYHVEMPTGDPMCPPDVRLAKRIREQIRDKAEIDDGEGELTLLDQEDNEDLLIERTDDVSEGKDFLEEETVENNVQTPLAGSQSDGHQVVAMVNNDRPLMPISGNISQIASACKSKNKRSFSDELIEFYKLKFMQKEEEIAAIKLRWEQEREEKELEFKRIKVESELRHRRRDSLQKRGGRAPSVSRYDDDGHVWQ